MKKKLFVMLAAAVLPLSAIQAQPKSVEGQRIYSVGILEMDDLSREDFSERFRDLSERHRDGNTRGAFMTALLAANRTALVTKISSTAEGLVDVAAARINNGVRSNRKKWEEAVTAECRFSKSLGMTEEIKDFYAAPSTRSALDAADMLFDGFTCRQDIKVGRDTVNVFYVCCKLDRSRIDRMISHSKFEVYVDSVRFNPYLCDIPNDSLTDVSRRIAFDFDKREDLRLKVKATVTSSWMNEAVMIFENQKLGEFEIEIRIDPNVVRSSPDGVYTYKAGRNPEQAGQVSVRGESFVVPRSYSGNDDSDNSLWGTGQYKVDMTITESCRIKQSYYQESAQGGPGGPGGKAKWNDNWKQEWKIIKSRPGQKSIWSEFGTVITTKWAGNGWLTEITSPTTSYLLQEGSTYLNGGVALTRSSASGMSGASGMAGGTQTAASAAQSGGAAPAGATAQGAGPMP